MHASFYMFEKELLHHKLVLQLPIFIFAFSMLLACFLLFGSNVDIAFSLNGFGDMFTMNIHQGLDTVIRFACASLSYLLSIIYLNKAMRKERQEGSESFWRSMPISDLLTHTVKLSFALLVIPLICSLLVLSAEIILWLIALFNPHQINLLIGDMSLINVLQNYLTFLFDMVMIGIALFPLACIIFAVSQRVNSPLLVVIIAIYALKIASSLLLPNSGLEQFFYQFLNLPTSLILTTSPTEVINQLPVVSTSIMYLCAFLALLTSLSIQKYGRLQLPMKR